MAILLLGEAVSLLRLLAGRTEDRQVHFQRDWNYFRLLISEIRAARSRTSEIQTKGDTNMPCPRFGVRTSSIKRGRPPAGRYSYLQLRLLHVLCKVAAGFNP